MNRRLRSSLGFGLGLCLISIGCDGIDIDTSYGRTRGPSINGTGVFAQILRERGHEVRAALRASVALSDWADVIVRFSPQPGPMDRDEGAWFSNWLNAQPSRRLIYIPHDFDAEAEFWQAMLAVQPKGTNPEKIRQIERKQKLSKSWAVELPPRSKTPADLASWFEFEKNPKPPVICKTLEGPWAEGLDATASALTRHEVFKVVGGEEIFLSGDGSPLVIGWSYANQSQVLVVANPSFLLNASFLNQARRPLAIRVSDWIGPNPVHVAFFEGRRVSDEDDEEASQFRLLGVAPFGWLAIHFVVFLAIFAFSMAYRLGRATPEVPSGVERPSAHPEALGALLARTRRTDVARFLLESYRRWRHQSPIAGRPAPNSPPLR